MITKVLARLATIFENNSNIVVKLRILQKINIIALKLREDFFTQKAEQLRTPFILFLIEMFMWKISTGLQNIKGQLISG